MSQTNVPYSHQVEAYKLEASGIRELFKLQLKDTGNTVLYLSPQDTIEWADQQWDEWPCKMSGYAQNSSGEKSRPKFTISNPEGVFSLWVGQGVVEGAILTHYEVLTEHIDSDARIYNMRLWIVNRVMSLNKNMIVLECRSTLDGHSFKIPGRAFYPPEYPHVTLR